MAKDGRESGADIVGKSSQQRSVATNGVYWGVRAICRRLHCSERTLFRWYRDLRFPMLQRPKGYAEFGTRAVWWTTEDLIHNWTIAMIEVQRKVKLGQDPWWAGLPKAHGVVLGRGLSVGGERKSGGT